MDGTASVAPLWWLRIRCWLVGCVLAAVGVTGAFAASPDETAEAQRLLAEGYASFEAGRFVDAASAFERAHALVPDPLNLRNIARAYEKAERPGLALAWLDRHLGSDDRPDRIARSKADRVRIAAAYLGLLVLKCEPAAVVVVDRLGAGVVEVAELGQPIRCPTKLEVEPGRYEVKARAEGHRPTERVVSVGPTEVVEVALALERRAAAPPVAVKAPVAPPPEAPPTEPPPPDDRPVVESVAEAADEGGLSGWTWTTGVLALATLGGGATYLVLAQMEVDDADAAYAEFLAGGRVNSGSRDDVEKDAGDAEEKRTIAYALLGAGAALAGLTVYLAIDDLTDSQASIVPTADGAAVVWGGTW